MVGLEVSMGFIETLGRDVASDLGDAVILGLGDGDKLETDSSVEAIIGPGSNSSSFLQEEHVKRTRITDKNKIDFFIKCNFTACSE